MTTPIYVKAMTKLPLSHYWSINNAAARRYLDYFYQIGLIDINLLSKGVSAEATHQFKIKLHKRNLALGSPIKTSKNVDAMSFKELLRVERQLLQYEILHAGPRTDVEFIRKHTAPQEKDPQIVDFLLHSINVSLWPAFFKSLATITVLGGTALALLATSDIIAVGIISTFILSTLACASLFDRHSKRSLGSMASDIKQVSSTWAEVFECKSFADATLLSLVAHYINHRDKIYIRWSDLTPAEALGFCQSLVSSWDSTIHLVAEHHQVSNTELDKYEDNSTTATSKINETEEKANELLLAVAVPVPNNTVRNDQQIFVSEVSEEIRPLNAAGSN